MMRKTIRLIDPDTGRPIELDFPHSTGTIDTLSDNYKCIMQIDQAYVHLFDFEHLNEMSAFESTVLLEYAADELKLALSLDSQKAIIGNAGSVCAVLLGWAILYPYGVWIIT